MKLLLIALAACLVFNSCYISGKKGNGKVNTMIMGLQPFTKLNLGTSCNVTLKTGSEYKAAIIADENLIKTVSVNQTGDKVEIETIENVRRYKEYKVEVYAPSFAVVNSTITGNLKSQDALVVDSNFVLNLSGTGNTNLRFNTLGLALKNTSTGNVNIEGSCTNALVESRGTGNLDLSDFKVENMNIKNTATGNVKINVKATLNQTDNGTGNFKNVAQ
jgi:hypothetical protein